MNIENNYNKILLTKWIKNACATTHNNLLLKNSKTFTNIAKGTTALHKYL